MKKKYLVRFFIVLAFLAVPALQLLAQDIAFKVLAENGKVQIRSRNEWQLLSAGTSLATTDVIKMEDGAYLGLVHTSGKTLALEKAGTYEVAHLNSRFKGEKPNVAAKYAELYIQKIQGGNMLNKQTTAPTTTASVERALQNSRLKVLLPNSVDVFSPEVILRWNDKDTLVRNSYEVVFKNMFDEVIMVKETDNTKITLDFSEKGLANERLVIVSVNAKQHKEVQSSNYGIKHMTPEEAEPIEKELKELRLEISEKESALDKLILASFYEQNNLLADALTNYEYAISLEPDVQAFRTAYEQFIFRNGLGY